MDTVTQPDANTTSTKPDDQVSFSVSPGLERRLLTLGASLCVTSYQSGALYLIGSKHSGGINIHQTGIQKPMGLAVRGDGGFDLTSLDQILRFANGLQPEERANEIFDGCFVPRTVHVTGQLDAHDVGTLEDNTPIFVNTRFNCLAVPDMVHSFKPVWRPSFISRIVDEDRCHLNGLAMRDNKPAFVTAVSASDTIDGWRDRRGDGGIVIDVESNKIVCSGLSMPHSPRWHDGKLWLLNSGRGELGYVDFEDKAAPEGEGVFVPVVFCPGFVRGLSFRGGYAFVGLSKPRYQRFEGLELDQRLKDADSEPWCGVQIIDLSTRSCVDWFRIDGAVGEIYDVATVPNLRCPMALAPGTTELRDLLTLSPETKTLCSEKTSD
ncbi:TIGR03032 family protein [Aliiroseovarius lamellibrachiae]|uniref:TIGR03032 family protein n=1 Tax=Aliiroseovarius lamellibrachiae TaxID=1924933 RepID=UPI001FEAB548|nr:TIGR03032 family protein [Aliiroseovarius lamellibrachiae]